MDTVKSFKGYGKVDEAENREFQRRTRRRIVLIAVSAVVLVAIIIGIVITVAVNKNGDNGSSQDASPSSISNSIKAMCSVTQYPDSCFASVSSMKESNSTKDPEELFKLSLRVAAKALSELSSLTDSVTIPSNDRRLEAAIRDCKELFDDSVDRLQDSISSMSPTNPKEKMLTTAKINDIRTWLSAAIANQETCLDGFEGTSREEELRSRFKAAMTNSTQFTSNSLAIVTGILGILRDLHFQLHRKLLSTSGTSQFPEWVTTAQRRALLQAPGATEPNVTVAQDGSGQVKTINEAVAMIPKKSLSPFVIYVKKGVYEENVVLDKSKWNVHIYGDGMYDTIVSGSLNFIDGKTTFDTATFGESLLACFPLQLFGSCFQLYELSFCIV